VSHRHDFGHSQRFVALDSAGQFATGNIALHHDFFAERPLLAGKPLRRVRLVSRNYDHAKGRAFRDWLDHIRRRQDVLGGCLSAGDDAMLGHRNSGCGGNTLRLMLVHGERRGEHAGMGVGNVQDLQHALDRAVLAIGSMQGIEDGIWPQACEHLGDVARHIDARDSVACLFQRLGARLSRGEAHRPLRGPATHQHGDVLCQHPLSGDRPRPNTGRQISNEELTARGNPALAKFVLPAPDSGLAGRPAVKKEWARRSGPRRLTE
jgi:hypothetical protein